ncbi:hypothetical protein B0J15DRAFT_486484 [Fusarium solani]|uniref:Uncharacterized protein n=1 Tax=Fusarium solani TaxID=169388 RepID=A0A9P9KT87_FUSSL|nr:uncharacterized protein B0J15DRAFT_486484 [Fusarium solani]KAH7268215.1 hypothetical protein B0J15DRAFT_486484 [Fusarium solani]
MAYVKLPIYGFFLSLAFYTLFRHLCYLVSPVHGCKVICFEPTLYLKTSRTRSPDSDSSLHCNQPGGLESATRST